MVKISILLLLITLGLNASDKKEDLLQKQIQKEMEKEQKYAQEQRFYQGSEYDLKGSEVNPESLKNIDDIEVDDMDMDHVYD